MGKMRVSKVKTTGFTDETILKAIKGSGGIITSIANKLGCAWDTANKYVNKNEKTRTAYKNEKEQILDLSETVVYQSIKNGNTQDAKWVLATLGKKRGFGETAPQVLDDAEDNELTIEIVDANNED